MHHDICKEAFWQLILRGWLFQARTLQEKGWQPRWFRKGKGKDTYEYIGGYWEAREKGRWDGCPDIFGPDPQEENVLMD